MLNMKKKNAITLLALVLTIVIMLLLAGIVIQMTLGENGLIVKSTQAQKEQAKAELYDTAKQSYTRLSLQAVENKMPKPGVEEVLTTEEFTAKYNVVGGNITDKKGTVIDTKEAVLEMLKTKYIVPTSELEEEENTPATPEETTPTPTPTPTPEETTPQVVWPKVVAGVTIPEEDKDNMILKLKILSNEEENIKFSGNFKVNYGEGVKKAGFEKKFTKGEYILNISDIKSVTIEGNIHSRQYELDVLQWGKNKNEEEGKNARISIYNVLNIYEPEEDDMVVEYMYGKFEEIPEWLYSKKKNAVIAGGFHFCSLKTVPQNLFKNWANLNSLENMFWHCYNLKLLPEELFKYNKKIRTFSHTFYMCKSLTNIPEDLFRYSTEVWNFRCTFAECYSLKSIPEDLFVNNKIENFEETFKSCSGIETIPEGLFRNNVETKKFDGTFESCTKLQSIPENLFKNNINVEVFKDTFDVCESLKEIPENLFKYNTKVQTFARTFGSCYKLKSIPENLFKYNVNVTIFSITFEDCYKLLYIPNTIIEHAKRVKEKGGNVISMFQGCTKASNYSSLPEYLIRWL